MASKKSSKKSSSKKSSQSQLVQAAAAGNVAAALAAVSTPAAPGAAKRQVILGCIVQTFFAQGFPHINSDQAVIVWGPIPENVIILLGNGVTGCINAGGFNCPPLAPAFMHLKNTDQSTVVADLVTGIAALVTP
jgi:hypothetical protein